MHRDIHLFSSLVIIIICQDSLYVSPLVEVPVLGLYYITSLIFLYPTFLFTQAVEATKNVELGNKELSQAIRRNTSSRTFLLLFLFVLTFSILFLDWYS